MGRAVRRWGALAIALAAGCGRGPFDVLDPDPCRDEKGLCISSSALQRAVDILFVIDNSGSMGDEQGLLARNFPAFVDVLEDQPFGASYRIGITTTDAYGVLRVASCRERLDEFLYSDHSDPTNPIDIDEQYDGCLSSCGYDVVTTVPTTTPADSLAVPRPWIEKEGERTNLADGLDIGEALGCAGPQGLHGSGFEAPLEAMRSVFADISGGATGFLRDEALLAVVFVTDETDCSMPYEHQSMVTDAEIGGALWSDPNDPLGPTSAVCWNAGTQCEGGPGIYDDCRAVDKDFDGELTAPEDAVLFPVSEYVEVLRDVAQGKAARGGTGQVLVAVIGGVPLDYPQTGAMLFQDSDDPAFNLEYGIGPGCGRGTELLYAPPGIPPVRLREFAEQFSTEGRNLYSICSPDYTPALEQMVDALETLSVRTCVPGCVADGDTDEDGLQAACRVVERDSSGEELGAVARCIALGDDWTFPSTSPELCYRALTDKSGATARTYDDMSAQCITQGGNLEIVIERPEGVADTPGRVGQVECPLDRPLGEVCDAESP
ncbi:MAG TPA: vWA domain-containing protein [Nannocystaceae bacterium]|nr:vWA domain-containing protein [Nannocystaceae bacterium]